MSAITMNLLPEDFREPPIYFCTACANYRQTDKQYLPGEQTFYQILLVTAGTGLLRHGNKTYSLSRGCAFFTALGEPSDYTDTGDLTTAFLTVRGNAMPQLLEHYGCGNFLFAQNIDLDRAVHAIREIIREYFDRKREGLLSAMAYSFFVDFLEHLRPDLYIERFAGEVPPRFVNHTPWGLIRNTELLRLLEQRLAERDTFQGKLYKKALI